MGNVEVTLAELRGMEPTDLGASSRLRVDQAQIDRFADTTDDHQWTHVDAERAVADSFSTTIAHGCLTLALLPRLLAALLVITAQMRGTNYGVDRVRFPSVVPVGSELVRVGKLLADGNRPDERVRYGSAPKRVQPARTIPARSARPSTSPTIRGWR